MRERVRPIAAVPLLRLWVLTNDVIEYRIGGAHGRIATELVGEAYPRLEVVVVRVNKPSTSIARRFGAGIWEVIDIFAKLPGKRAAAVLIFTWRKEIITTPKLTVSLG